jgi:hypothetical protein
MIYTRPLRVNDHHFVSPAIGADGTLYEATRPGIVCAASPAGRIAWRFDINQDTGRAP